MPKLLATTLLSMSFVVGSFAADAGVDTDFTVPEQVRELLSETVKEFRAGRSSEATARIRDALKLNPDNKQLYEFYLAAGDALLLKMSEYDKPLEKEINELLRRARIYQKDLRTSPEYIGILISKLDKSEEERLVASNELAAVGPLAVPYLVALLGDNRQDDMRVYCRVVLNRMGYRAVIPLTMALRSSDERLVTSVMTSLADIGDARALPFLQRIQETSKAETIKRVAGNAANAIASRNKIASPGSADQLFFQEALRYFRGDDLVRDEMIANEVLMWAWDDIGKRLQSVRVPRYAWNELMAESLIFDALASYPQSIAYHPLLAATYAAEDLEAQRRVRIAKERTTPIENTDESLDFLAARVQTLGEMHLRVRMFGAENIYNAIRLSITSERLEVATYLMRLLEDRGLANPDVYLPTGSLVEKADKAENAGDESSASVSGLTKAGSVLVAALDHPDKMVRYQAAITLAKLDPSVRFFGAEKVIPVLADAAGEWGMRVVLVIDQEFRQRNVAREQLQHKGYRVYAVQDGFECMQRLEETPMKDVIIISGDLVPYLRDSTGAFIDVPEQKALTLVERLRKDWRSEKTPIFISLPEDAALSAKLQNLFEGKVNGFIQKPFNTQEMSDQIEVSLQKADLPNANREDADDVSLRATQALAGIDPLHTQYDLTQAGDSLVKALPARIDTVRIAALHALGNAAKGANGETIRKLVDKVTDAYGVNDATLKPELRGAFLYAIGQMNPTTDAAISILTLALKHEDATVRSEAARAVGHAPMIDPSVLYRFQLQQRLELQKQAVTAVAVPAATVPVPAVSGDAATPASAGGDATGANP